ncbi:MAG: alpha/beta fold hydrolase [Candidatus Eisenbacteria bacterium]|uniref:Alpha/beta hydrolase n=1 Tax=Eiseniibacteriota bacterium TaxID=2212470 RepID=A0A956LVV1_UNCEI|nr:alpha/beta hydrolase [Candidatus Eisenbacteria bacterium]
MIYRFGPYELDEENRELRRGGAPIDLQPLVFQLLATLVRNHRRVVPKDELIALLWPSVIVTDASLQRAISLARTVLQDESHTLIRTLHRYGYRFSGLVQIRDSGTEPTDAPSDPPPFDAPEIRHVRTQDGVDIAFWTLGEGPPLVYVPNLLWSHGVLEWELPDIRNWYARLARHRLLIRFDPRGTGASQRRLTSYSIAAIQHDLDAVAGALGLSSFDLFGDLNSGAVAMRYAAKHPDRVSRLVLWHAFARTKDIDGPKMNMLSSLQPLMVQDWETYTETRAHMGFGWSDGASAHRYAALLRACVDPETALQSYRAGRRDDVTALLPRIGCPTLILHRRGFYFWDTSPSQGLAEKIPNARTVLLDGAGSAPFLGDTEGVIDAIEGFLGSD